MATAAPLRPRPTCAFFSLAAAASLFWVLELRTLPSRNDLKSPSVKTSKDSGAGSGLASAASASRTRLTAADFKSILWQAAVFTPDEEVSPGKLIGPILAELSRKFDGEPVVLPPVDAMPRDIPRIILQSKRGDWRLEIASARTSLTWQRPLLQDDPAPDFASESKSVLLFCASLMRARVGRVGMVQSRIAPHETPGIFLARHFCQERWWAKPLNRPASFELHAHKAFDLPGSTIVNSWVRAKSASSPSGPVVLVEQDINTLLESIADRAMSQEEIGEFLGATAREFDNILQVYFPQSED
jgi:hypothetical protein